MSISLDGTAVDNTTASGSPPTQTLTLTPGRAGDFVGLFVAANQAAAGAPTVSDSSGVTTGWINIAGSGGHAGSGGNPLYFFYTMAGSAIAIPITIAWTSLTAPNYNSTLAFAFAGVKSSSFLDPLGSGTTDYYTIGGAGNGVASIGAATAMTVVTTVDGVTIVGGWRLGNGASSTAGAGFTLITPTGNQNYTCWEYQASPQPAGSQTADIGSDAGDSGADGIAFALVPAPGASGGIPYNPWPQLGPIVSQHHKSFSGWRRSFERRRFERRSPRGIILPPKLWVPNRKVVA